jgi:hypothetical protein
MVRPLTREPAGAPRLTREREALMAERIGMLIASKAYSLGLPGDWGCGDRSGIFVSDL